MPLGKIFEEILKICSDINTDTILKACEYIDNNGVPPRRTSINRYIEFDNGKKYPTKYVIEVANNIILGHAGDKELKSQHFASWDAEHVLYELIPEPMPFKIINKDFKEIRQNIINKYKDLGYVIEELGDYTAIKKTQGQHRNNTLVEIEKIKRSRPFSIRIAFNKLDNYLQEKCEKVPETYHWSNDAIFKIDETAETEKIAYEIIDNIIKKTDETESEEIKGTDITGLQSNCTNHKIALNQILYGPPGTGKTYNTIVKAMEFINNAKYEHDTTNKSDSSRYKVISQKFESKSKKPTIDEYQKWFSKNKSVSNRTLNRDYFGALKRFDKELNILNIKNQEDFNKYIKEIEESELFVNKRNISKNNIANFKSVTKPYMDFYNYWKTQQQETPEVANKNVVLYKDLQKSFREELEKKFDDETKQIEFITFHQSYSYEEFVEGIKPEVEWSDDNKNKKQNSKNNKGISYIGKKGIFREICARAEQHPNGNYVLIIDEINRGNISKIFGELITLIEDDKRKNVTGDTLKEYNTIEVTLPYSGDTFSVPNNLYIIGTMNTSDRSIASVDIALRRRFKFVEMMPIENIIPEKVEDKINLRNIFNTLNQRICALLDRDHQIGHSYFKDVKTVTDLKDVWFDCVMPLLNEYFYGDWEKLQAILGIACDDGFIKSISVCDDFFAVNKSNVFDNDNNEYYEFNSKENTDIVTALSKAFPKEVSIPKEQNKDSQSEDVSAEENSEK